jgi:hypothetical protein
MQLFRGDMERTLLTLTPANVITVTLCGLLGYGLLVGVAKAYQSLTGRSMGSSPSSASNTATS